MVAAFGQLARGSHAQAKNQALRITITGVEFKEFFLENWLPILVMRINFAHNSSKAIAHYNRRVAERSLLLDDAGLLLRP